MKLIDKNAVEFFNKYWSPKMGAIDGHDLRFIEALLSVSSPKTVVEIGCATGLSTSMMAIMLEKQSGAKIHSYDLAERFYADPSKNTGFLIKDIPALESVEIELNTRKTCLSVQDHHKPKSIDFCFIDAAHTNPWPAIDTLALLPHMKPESFVVQHDLQMFRGNKGRYATGPKVLYELTPRKMRLNFFDWVSEADAGPLKTRGFANNIYAIRIPNDVTRLARRISEAFLIGWDRRTDAQVVPPEFADAFEAFLERNYPAIVARNFRIGRERYDMRISGAARPEAHSIYSRALRLVGRNGST